MFWKQQFIVLTSVRRLVKVLDIFADRVPEGRFAEEDHPVEALVFSG
jgi:hypothetical protein